MKRIIKVLGTLILTVLLLTSCGKSKKTLIYGDINLSKYVKLGEYKGLTVDTSSEEYKNEFDSILETDIKRNGIFEKKTEGRVESGDVANIDYEGKKDGVAFEGGTSEGYDLTIGSGTFIAGFEDGLIGVNIGDTVDLNLTFPENYGSEELAGAAVVFTVKVNYVKVTEGVDARDYYEQLGFSSKDEYEADVQTRAIKNTLSKNVIDNSEVKEYPEKEKDKLIDAIYEYYDNYYNSAYNVSFEDVLTQNSMTVTDFKNEMSSSIEEDMKNQMVYYAIIQKEGLGTEYELKDGESANQEVLDEITKVGKIVQDFLYENSKK